MTNPNSNRGPFALFTILAVPVMAAVLCATAGAQASATNATTQSSGLTVTYIAHCGFLFSSGGQKILTDALIEPSKEWPYDAPSPDLLKKMERGEPPFDHINVVLISHNHIDHHSPALDVKFLLNNPKSVLVTTPEVRLQMEHDSPEFKQIESQVIVPDLDWKQSTTLEVNGIKLELARLKHGDDGQWRSIVYAALFDMGGKKVLFAPATLGYFPEEYETLGYAKRGIDLAFLNFTLAIQPGPKWSGAALNTAGIQTVRNLIAPKVVVLMHVEGPARASVEKLLPEVEKQLPGTIWFQHELESRTF
ncbi:MAG: MBL fold metallo-hydrolase [Terracidiphilus sp.]|jgi:L-ascorbate metabolism protein UlaG (beta-lactamase superfamily)